MADFKSLQDGSHNNDPCLIAAPISKFLKGIPRATARKVLGILCIQHKLIITSQYISIRTNVERRNPFSKKSAKSGPRLKKPSYFKQNSVFIEMSQQRLKMVFQLRAATRELESAKQANMLLIVQSQQTIINKLKAEIKIIEHKMRDFKIQLKGELNSNSNSNSNLVPVDCIVPVEEKKSISIVNNNNNSNSNISGPSNNNRSPPPSNNNKRGRGRGRGR